VKSGLLAVLAACTSLAGAPGTASDGGERGAAEEKRSLRAALESLELSDLEGKQVRLSSYLGRGPVLLDFWATWCKPCLLALPELDKLHAALAPRGLQVVGINEDGPRNAAKVKPFMKSKGYDFPVLLDLNREAQSALQAIALPTTLLLDADGAVVHTSFGYHPGEYEALRAKIEPLLEEESDPRAADPQGSDE
jgi:thiol-disulfide isomerase/thioredoxin